MIQLTKSRMMSERVKHGIHARKNSRWVFLILIQQSIQISRVRNQDNGETATQTITEQADSKTINVIQLKGTEHIFIFQSIAIPETTDKDRSVLHDSKHNITIALFRS